MAPIVLQMLSIKHSFQTKENEMARKKKPVRVNSTKKKLIRNLGGCLPNPPKECSFSRVASDGGIWTDFGCCLGACKERCDLYKWVCKAGLEERREYWRKCGVRNFF